MVIQSVMLAALGFLVASLLALILAPALWRRGVRLTTSRIRASMPLTLNEIQADKDRLRADFAIKIRKYEVALEKEKMKAAHQLVDISRRDTEINSLQSKIEEIRRDLEEQQSANRVYSQTISLRIPNMESQLEKAKELLGARYHEITKLRTTINRQENKLGEAQAMSQMRKAELDRLRVALESSVQETLDIQGIEQPQTELEKAESHIRELGEELSTLRLKLNGSVNGSAGALQTAHIGEDDDIEHAVGRILDTSSEETPEVLSEEKNEGLEETAGEQENEAAFDAMSDSEPEPADSDNLETEAEETEQSVDNETAENAFVQAQGEDDSNGDSQETETIDIKDKGQMAVKAIRPKLRLSDRLKSLSGN